MWLTAKQALGRLQSKPQSLYASVSRGRIRARPDPSDSRRSLYFEADVDRLAARARGRRSTAAVVEEAISWGEPVLGSAITAIAGGRLFYRGRNAVELAESATLEEVAGLLWGGGAPPVQPVPVQGAGLHAVMVALAELSAVMPPSAARPMAQLRADAAAVFALLAAGLAGLTGGPVHERLADAWKAPHAANLLRRALVLLADHELNASTFAARVAVSTGASLAAGTLAALATFGGPRHGRASAEVSILAEDIGAEGDNAAAALRHWLGEGRGVPGFGHRLYPGGDVRAKALLQSLDVPPAYRALARAAAEVAGEAPNIDFALAAIAATHALPADAPAILFALGRSVGWLAHMLEQSASGTLIRPRARYVGEALPAR
jgi:citrate synthase